MPYDRAAGGAVLRGTRDVAFGGNVFSGVGPKALTLVGEPSRRILFSANVVASAESDHGRLSASVVETNLEAAPVAE